jgi:hypothetical protein
MQEMTDQPNTSMDDMTSHTGISPDLSGGVREPAPTLTLTDRLALFADAMLEFWSDGSSPDGFDIQDIAHHLGLLIETKFDSEIHTDEAGLDVDDGDQWFVLAEPLNAAIRQATAAQDALSAATAGPAERRQEPRDDQKPEQSQ